MDIQKTDDNPTPSQGTGRGRKRGRPAGGGGRGRKSAKQKAAEQAAEEQALQEQALQEQSQQEQAQQEQAEYQEKDAEQDEQEILETPQNNLVQQQEQSQDHSLQTGKPTQNGDTQKVQEQPQLINLIQQTEPQVDTSKVQKIQNQVEDQQVDNDIEMKDVQEPDKLIDNKQFNDTIKEKVDIASIQTQEMKNPEILQTSKPIQQETSVKLEQKGEPIIDNGLAIPNVADTKSDQQQQQQVLKSESKEQEPYSKEKKQVEGELKKDDSKKLESRSKDRERDHDRHRDRDKDRDKYRRDRDRDRKDRDKDRDKPRSDRDRHRSDREKDRDRGKDNDKSALNTKNESNKEEKKQETQDTLHDLGKVNETKSKQYKDTTQNQAKRENIGESKQESEVQINGVEEKVASKAASGKSDIQSQEVRQDGNKKEGKRVSLEKEGNQGDKREKVGPDADIKEGLKQEGEHKVGSKREGYKKEGDRKEGDKDRGRDRSGRDKGRDRSGRDRSGRDRRGRDRHRSGRRSERSRSRSRRRRHRSSSYDSYESRDRGYYRRRRRSSTPINRDHRNQNYSFGLEPTDTIYISGIPTHVDEAELNAVFEKFFKGVKSVRLQRERSSNASRGFAFMDMESVDHARLVIEGPYANNIYVGGSKNSLTLEYSQSQPHPKLQQSQAEARMDWICNMCSAVNFARRLDCYQCNTRRAADVKRVSADQEGPSKILKVQGLDSQISEQHLQALFGGDAVITDIRIVREKFSQQPRGFGFVEFATISEASKILNKFQNFSLQNQNLKINFARDRVQGTEGARKEGNEAIEAAQAQQQYTKAQNAQWQPKQIDERKIVQPNVQPMQVFQQPQPFSAQQARPHIMIQPQPQPQSQITPQYFSFKNNKDVMQDPNIQAQNQTAQKIAQQQAQQQAQQIQAKQRDLYLQQQKQIQQQQQQKAQEQQASEDEEILEQLIENGYTYDQDSGYYYHAPSGYYYDRKTHLYYHGQSNQWYRYDTNTNQYIVVQDDENQKSQTQPQATQPQQALPQTQSQPQLQPQQVQHETLAQPQYQGYNQHSTPASFPFSNSQYGQQMGGYDYYGQDMHQKQIALQGQQQELQQNIGDIYSQNQDVRQKGSIIGAAPQLNQQAKLLIEKERQLREKELEIEKLKMAQLVAERQGKQQQQSQMRQQQTLQQQQQQQQRPYALYQRPGQQQNQQQLPPQGGMGPPQGQRGPSSGPIGAPQDDRRSHANPQNKQQGNFVPFNYGPAPPLEPEGEPIRPPVRANPYTQEQGQSGMGPPQGPYSRAQPQGFQGQNNSRMGPPQMGGNQYQQDMQMNINQQNRQMNVTKAEGPYQGVIYRGKFRRNQ